VPPKCDMRVMLPWASYPQRSTSGLLFPTVVLLKRLLILIGVSSEPSAGPGRQAETLVKFDDDEEASQRELSPGKSV